MLGPVRSWRPWQVHQPPRKAFAAFWKAYMTEKLLCGWALSDNCGAASLRWLRSWVCKLHGISTHAIWTSLWKDRMERPCRYRYRSLWARKIRKCLPLGETIQLQGNQRSRIGVCIELAGDSTWTSFLVPFWLVLWMVFNLYYAEASWPNETWPCTKIVQSFMVSTARTLKAAESFLRKMLITIDLLPTSH